jgi:glycosyltransferase involved in cell wall biosynthesis
MHIAIDARLTYYSQAGISHYIQRLVRELPRLDPTIRWSVLQSRRHTRSLDPQRRINALTPCHHRLERWALGIELLPRRLDLFHAPDFIPPAFGARRMVITVHDLNFVHFPHFLTPDSLRYYAGQIRWAIGRADHILADSDQTRQDLLNLLDVPADKVTTVHLAADEHFRPLSRPGLSLARYGLEPGYLLFVGTLEPRKNIPTLLQAYRQLLDRRVTDQPLILVGRPGWLSDEIFATQARLRLGDRVRILEDVYEAETLVELYNGAAVLAIPSFYEGFGLPALEAMACGVPVVAADRGSLPEIVADAGLLIDPEQPDEVAAALERVLTDLDLRSDLVTRGLARAGDFGWTETARKTLAAYRRVLGLSEGLPSDS